MCDEPYMIMGLGNAYDFVIKNVNEPETYGTFQGDEKSIKKFVEKVNSIVKENEQLKDKYNEQSVEYEGLEEQIERLLNFKDKVFELFNREIEHNTDAILQATNEDVDCATIGFHTKMLKRYKKELSE